MLKLKRNFLIITFFIASIFTSSTRSSVYGATIENTKPFRQTITTTAQTIPSYALGIKDVWALAMLVGVYFLFTRKRNNARSVGF